ncbi:ribosome small subunit-dependent GTPase A [bacterium]|nr:ribosome small subunit-dependent GTPase A [bacterium]
MQGQVLKIFSDFYYVDTQEYGIIECKLREILKKKEEAVIVGDFVTLEAITKDNKQAFIASVQPRKNFLSRPKVANISQAIIVSALKHPDLDYEQLNRYIALCEYHKIKINLCFNKCDLIKDKEIIEEIKSIYEPLGYSLFFTSAKLNEGFKDIEKILEGNISILCGTSGVGKSSVINILSNGIFKLEVKNVSDKTKRGVHTTRHCEIYKISQNTSVVDTPGFSNVKFNFIMPQNIQNLFPEIKKLSNCKYTDCLHICENDCNIIFNIDKIASSRYKSYIKFVEEAKEYKKKIIYEGNKTESSSKYNKGVEMVKISGRKRMQSRKVLNQNIVEYEE